MIKPLIWILRIILLAMIGLPLLFPYVLRSSQQPLERGVSVLMPFDLPLSAALIQKVKGALADANQDQKFQFVYEKYGQIGQSALQRFDELGQLIANQNQLTVVLQKPNLWGPASGKFNSRILETNVAKQSLLIWIDPSPSGERFLGLNSLQVPAVSFLGEVSLATIDILGRMNPGEQQNLEVVLRSGGALVHAQKIDVTADKVGAVKVTQSIPVSFVRAGSQVLTATLNTPLSPPTLNSASTSISVVHSKTTLLHVAVGPDWSVRNFRQKMKFWPNLDLLSYYILRELTDDLSIPPSQLSLIEFPSQKLFGEELDNIHGVVAQNFAFDQYLQGRDAMHLLEYVKKGGRMLVLGGPLSFLSKDPALQELFPCKNQPRFDRYKTYQWETGSTQFASDQLDVSGITSASTAVDCDLKDNVLVYAQTKEGGRPILVATQIEKGLVVTVLAQDWQIDYLKSIGSDPASMARQRVASESVERMGQWLIEFLQRRQDSGLRPPDLAGPRIYADDHTFALKAKGSVRLNTTVNLIQNGSKVGSGQVTLLPFLQMPVVTFEQSLQSTSALDALHLEFDNQPSQRRGMWPVNNGTSLATELNANPLLTNGLMSALSSGTNAVTEKSNSEKRQVPLLLAYPWLVALALAILALEQYLSHILANRMVPAGRSKR